MDRLTKFGKGWSCLEDGKKGKLRLPKDKHGEELLSSDDIQRAIRYREWINSLIEGESVVSVEEIPTWIEQLSFNEQVKLHQALTFLAEVERNPIDHIDLF